MGIRNKDIGIYVTSSMAFNVLALFAILEVALTPYIGFLPDAAEGQAVVWRVFQQPANRPGLQLGDILVQIGEVKVEDYLRQPRLSYMAGLQKGDELPVVVSRGGETLLVRWTVAGYNTPEVFHRLSWMWIPLVFWIFGAVALYQIRPLDARTRLFAAACFITAAYSMWGNMSYSHLWWTGVLTRASIWLFMPVYLHFHWTFPRPFRALTRLELALLYVPAVALAVLQWLSVIPVTLYFLGLVIALAGSVILLVVHAIDQPDVRRDLRLLLVATLLIVLPLLSLGLSGVYEQLYHNQAGVIFLTPIIPGTYLYVIFRRQIGGLSVRANRITASLLFFLIVITLASLAAGLAAWAKPDPVVWPSITSSLAILSGMTSALIYPRFKRWVERRFLGIPLPKSGLTEKFTNRITISLEKERVVRLLSQEMLPSLQVRQAAIIYQQERTQKLSTAFVTLLAIEVEPGQLPTPGDVPFFLSEAGRPLARLPKPAHLRWVQLALVMTVEGQPVGLGLFGLRDPDDEYGPADIQTLQALLNQSALALVYIDQAQHLRSLYQKDLERQEDWRAHLARELHDDVLRQLSLLAYQVGETGNPGFQEAYESAVHSIRSIITGLRPTLLAYGLHTALSELADQLQVMTQAASTAAIHAGALPAAPQIQLDLPYSAARYPPEVELHLYRIVQEACDNALRHGRANQVCVGGMLLPGYASLVVEDDGTGFSLKSDFDLDWLLANQHFGLAGMNERARRIGARLQISSDVGRGTKVEVQWKK